MLFPPDSAPGDQRHRGRRTGRRTVAPAVLLTVGEQGEIRSDCEKLEDRLVHVTADPHPQTPQVSDINAKAAGVQASPPRPLEALMFTV